MSATTHEMKPVGTMVIANDGFTTRMGQIADHETNRWGTFHVVSIDGECELVGHIMEKDGLGIGWKVATDAEIARAIRDIKIAYETPCGTFDTWEAAADACERCDLDPVVCIAIIRKGA